MDESFEQNGWGVFPKLFNKNEVENIIELIYNFIKNNEDKMEIWDMNKTENGNVNSIHCLHLYDDSLLNFFKKKKVLFDLAQKILNDEVEIIAIESFLKPARDGKPVVIHQDNYLWCLEKGNAFTLWIALDDVDKENGGLRYYSGSHKLGLLEHEPSYKIGTSQTIKKSEYEKFKDCDVVLNNLEKGDAQFHHSLCIHDSEGNNSDRRRRAVTIQFKSINDKLDVERRKKYREEVLKQQKILKKVI